MTSLDVLFGELPSLRVRFRRAVYGLIFLYFGVFFSIFIEKVDESAYTGACVFMLGLGSLIYISCFFNWRDELRLRKKRQQAGQRYIA